MRFIDNRPLLAPEGWQERADVARNAVIDHGEDVNAYGAVWRELKDALAELSHDKCWYCEMRQERSDNAVDHFRPKAVYRWLAFSLRNFRYACTFCNSRRTDAGTGLTGGKGDHFPLEAGCARAESPGEEAQERSLLLTLAARQTRCCWTSTTTAARLRATPTIRGDAFGLRPPFSSTI